MVNISGISSDRGLSQSKQLVVQQKPLEPTKETVSRPRQAEAPFAGLPTDDYVIVDGRKLFFNAHRGTYLDIWV